jgi:negative regulator of flagellin synthesis FlgM
MQIYGPNSMHGIQHINPPHTSHANTAPQRASAPATDDQVEISQLGQLLDQVRDLPEIRQDRVAALRQAIADGTYDTPERMDVALSRLLDEIA